MILFLNFAPIEYMGGAEKWINDTAKKLNTSEDVALMTVSSSIANVYGKIVLGRPFDFRNSEGIIGKRIVLRFKSFIPFSKAWKEVVQNMNDARLLYIKFEILELGILWYFGGLSIFKKTVAGVHSPFHYSEDFNFFAWLHRMVYQSKISDFFLRRMKKIHVINKRDQKYFVEKLNLHNVTFVPHGIAKNDFSVKVRTNDNNILDILFVGELNIRKGTDILIETIKQSDDRFYFHIVGSGPMYNELEQLKKKKTNFSYYGFLQKREIRKMYEKSDIFFLPSRGESFGLVFLEAMIAGLIIVNSENVSLLLPKKIERSIQPSEAKKYLAVFAQILKLKKMKKINRNEIREFCLNHFSSKVIDKQLKQDIFYLK